jgi:hypothetical protein
MKRASSSGFWCRTCFGEQSRPQGDVRSAHCFHGINRHGVFIIDVYSILEQVQHVFLGSSDAGLEMY